MRKKIALLCFPLLFAGVFVSCKKNAVDNEVQSVIDNALCEQEFMRIPVLLNGRAIQVIGIKKLMPGYGKVWSNTCPKDTLTGDTTGYAAGTYTNTSNLPVLQLDWSSGCTDQLDGVTRSGKLNALFTKPYSQPGTVVTVTPVNYKAGSLAYSGTIKITRTATHTLSVEVTNGQCTNGSFKIGWSCTRTITWVSGMGDMNEQNDVFEISGNASGTNRDGKTFTANITTPLVKSADCKWISKGVLELTPDGLKTRVVDFGDGKCNAEATFSLNGNTYTFNMQ